jgi:hypothetical protein
MEIVLVIGVFFIIIAICLGINGSKLRQDANSKIEKYLLNINNFSATSKILSMDMSKCIAIDSNTNSMCIININGEEITHSMISNFSVNQRITSFDTKKAIFLDEKQKKVCFIDMATATAQFKIASGESILSIEVVEDGKTITKTDRGSQIGGALIGGLAFGGVGAVIGGLSGKTSSEIKVNKLTLHLIIDDVQRPVFDIDLLSFQTQKGSFTYQEAVKKIDYWYGLLSVLVNSKKETTKVPNESLIDSNTSMSDELLKIADLRKTGILSEEEYIQCKAKIINTK